ncbi:hypothetical protein GOODEAATRI_008995 [Goodea atripinnis]|uniref:Uncharacterized protein n=1 Tax=Goodea atripinnis TaxID=208336 RepID=A0ABV0MQJ0_9TELE
MHNTENPDDHDHIYLFQDDKVYSYFNQNLEEGYPKQIEEDFPGVPTHLDAATKTWSHLPSCTSAFRWLEHYYCFHGHNFTRFHPVSGEVTGAYPKDARHYFMNCPNFGHGGDRKPLKCSDVKLSAATTDDGGRTVVGRVVPLPLSNIDASLCGEDGIKIFIGSQFYRYESPMILAMSRIAPVPVAITSAMMPCED